MKSWILILGLLVTPWSAKAADLSPSQVEAMMQKSDCFTCHSVRHKVVGPAYIDVAKRYRGKKGIVEILVKKVKMGGSGNWGNIPMVAHPDIKDADLRAMVKWVLSRK